MAQKTTATLIAVTLTLTLADTHAPAGPAFHSAGPRSNGDRREAEVAADDATASEEISDEAATA